MPSLLGVIAFILGAIVYQLLMANFSPDVILLCMVGGVFFYFFGWELFWLNYLRLSDNTRPVLDSNTRNTQPAYTHPPPHVTQIHFATMSSFDSNNTTVLLLPRTGATYEGKTRVLTIAWIAGILAVTLIISFFVWFFSRRFRRNGCRREDIEQAYQHNILVEAARR
ncbi:hypothetical protein DV735_g2088, partial [Chaetothyriales sp. CBS 134920]